MATLFTIKVKKPKRRLKVQIAERIVLAKKGRGRKERPRNSNRARKENGE